MYLVTGGAGFIGSHLCEALLAQGHAVRVLDDFSTGKPENLPAGIQLVIGDVSDGEIVRCAVEGVVGCFHLAAIASVERSKTDWLGTHRTNLTGMITLLDAVSRLPGRPPVVYASSAAVYGDEPALALGSPKRPLTAYGADKYGCELHARVAGLVHGVPTTGLRFFNVYGPRQDPKSPYSGVISIFCEKLRRQEPIDIFGDGKQTRDFIYVTDVVDALIAGMRWPSLEAPVWNVCTGTTTSVLDLAHTIAGLLKITPEIRYQWPRAGDIRHSGASPIIREALGLPEPVPLVQGLSRVLQWLGAEKAGSRSR